MKLTASHRAGAALAALVCLGLVACGGSSAPTKLTPSAERHREASLCASALSRTASALASGGSQGFLKRRVLQRGFTVSETSMATIIHGLSNLRPRVSDKSTISRAIQLDQQTKKLEHDALEQINDLHSKQLSRAQFNRIYGPVAHSEAAAATHLATTSLPLDCIGHT